MPYDVSAKVQTVIQQKMATGQYSSPDDLLLRALDALSDYEGAMADIQAGIADEAAGRMRPVREVDAEIRKELGFSK